MVLARDAVECVYSAYRGRDGQPKVVARDAAVCVYSGTHPFRARMSSASTLR